MSNNELISKVREYKETQALADELAAMMESIKDEIKEYMTAQGVEEIQVDVFKVRWTPVTTKRFDTTAFKINHADFYSHYLKETVTRRFTVN